MKPITNSVIKERYRINNENMAIDKASLINQKLCQDINALKQKPVPYASPYLRWSAGIGFFLGLVISVNDTSFDNFGNVFLISIAIGIVIWLLQCESAKSFNKHIDTQKSALEQKAKDAINKAFADADTKTKKEIECYDKAVTTYFRKIKNNRDSLDRMVDFACRLFDDSLMYAENQSSNTERFVVLDFEYTVSTTNILYSNSIGKSDIYDFKTQRYRCLDKDSECEALAAVLAKIICGYVLKKYNSQQGQLKYKNNDARVLLHFEMPNKNFIPATVIV